MGTADSMIRAFQAGRQMKLAREEMARRDEDRQLERELLKDRLARMRTEDKFQAWQRSRAAAEQNLNLLSGQPAEDAPLEAFDFTTQPKPAAPQDPTGLGMPLPAMQDVQTRETMRPVTFPGVQIPEMGLDVPAVQKRPQTLEQVLAQRISEERLKGFEKEMNTGVTLGPGQQRFLGGELVASGGPREANWQSGSYFVDGRPKTLNFNPVTREYRDASTGAPVTGDIRPVPPASVQVQMAGGMAGGQNVPGDWGLEGRAFLQTIPERWRKTVEKIAQYDVDLTKVTSLRNNERSMVQAWVNQVNPTYDSTVAPARMAVRREFLSGMASRNVRSLNTVISHTGKLLDAAAALKTGDVQAVNRFVNWAKTQLGRPEVTNFNSAATAVIDEAGTVFKGTAATDEQIKYWERALNPKMSPDQLLGSVTTLADLFAGRFSALAGQYESGMGRKDINFLNKESRETLRKMGVDVETWEPEANQTAYDSARQAMGASGTDAGAAAPAPTSGVTVGQFVRTKDGKSGYVQSVDAQGRFAIGPKKPAAAPTTSTPPAAAPSAGTAGGISVTAPDGLVYTFPNQAQADAFKKAAGIK